MKCLVTGGCGFIGSNLVGLLLEKGHDVVILDDLSTGTTKNLPTSDSLWRFVLGSVTDYGTVAQVILGCEVIFHLAASVGNVRSLANPLTDAKVNVQGTLNVLNAAKEARVQRVVYSSSAGIFGELEYLPIDERHPCRPNSPYGCTKLCAENLCSAYSKVYGLNTVCLRYFNVYGPRQRYDAYGNVIPIFADRLLKRESLVVYGDGCQTRDFVHVRDVVQANYLAATTTVAHGAYNIGSGVGVCVNDLVRLMGGRDVVYEDARPGDVLHSVASIDRAHRELDYLPSIDLQDGLQEYQAWYRGDQI